MSIKRREDVPPQKIQIDLCGPGGNAFALLGTCERLAKQLNIDWEPIKENAISDDYEHLLAVLDEHFGHMIDFVR